MKTAIFIDAGFFLKRFKIIYPKINVNDPKEVAQTIYKHAIKHLPSKIRSSNKDNHTSKKIFKDHLYRIFVYDCEPSIKKIMLPVSKRTMDLSKSNQAVFMKGLFIELRKMRKVALRLGKIDDANLIWFPRD